MVWHAGGAGIGQLIATILFEARHAADGRLKSCAIRRPSSASCVLLVQSPMHVVHGTSFTGHSGRWRKMCDCIPLRCPDRSTFCCTLSPGHLTYDALLPQSSPHLRDGASMTSRSCGAERGAMVPVQQVMETADKVCYTDR